MNTKQKTALVTGGGSGLGYAIASKFVERGIHTIILGRSMEKLTTACEHFGELCNYEQYDLAELDGIPDMAATIIEKHGPIDILVNNAGIHQKKSLFDVSHQDFLKVIEINQVSVLSLSREIARHMAEHKSGAILNISSMASQYGIPYVIAYTSTKSAIEGMTRAMAVELSPLGIRVNCIAPGFIETDMSRKALDNDPERKNKVLSRTPLGRLGKPEDVADAAYYLCSEQAGYITGVVLPVDGGNSIGF
ncbi:MAG: SDR family oxidoreductase [candidate division KSB1 bacterium]|nr:SDR family oxidoreductase [candidate division KSB1 bacterium]